MPDIPGCPIAATCIFAMCIMIFWCHQKSSDRNSLAVFHIAYFVFLQYLPNVYILHAKLLFVRANAVLTKSKEVSYCELQRCRQVDVTCGHIKLTSCWLNLQHIVTV